MQDGWVDYEFHIYLSVVEDDRVMRFYRKSHTLGKKEENERIYVDFN